MCEIDKVCNVDVQIMFNQVNPFCCLRSLGGQLKRILKSVPLVQVPRSELIGID